jgi:uncharacterized membrane protein
MSLLTSGEKMRIESLRGRPRHPALLKHHEERRKDVQSRLADAITHFAGSMPFVYIHIVWFAAWVGFRVEPFPFGFLTMIVSLEAIFLSTFVMLSQNRADERRQVLADHEWELVQAEEKQNEELISISRQILELSSATNQLAMAVHSATVGRNDSKTALQPKGEA